MAFGFEQALHSPADSTRKDDGTTERQQGGAARESDFVFLVLITVSGVLSRTGVTTKGRGSDCGLWAIYMVEDRPSQPFCGLGSQGSSILDSSIIGGIGGVELADRNRINQSRFVNIGSVRSSLALCACTLDM